MSSVTEVSSNQCFGGSQKVLEHRSKELDCTMRLAVFLPDKTNMPVVYWLSGLTCNEQNFITKAGAQRCAAELGLVLVCPDTSPRGVNLPGEDDSYDFGSGAGFYLDAELEPWKKHYRMFSYVTKELPDLIAAQYPGIVDTSRQSIMGHSMGGHGALVCALKCPGLYRSVSAFSPICRPTACPWGIKALSGYLGGALGDGGAIPDIWRTWDATCLVGEYNGPPLALFIDQGSADNFLKDNQLQPQQLMEACSAATLPCILKMREGYDHSYFYIATFIEEHLRYHAEHLTD